MVARESLFDRCGTGFVVAVVVVVAVVAVVFVNDSDPTSNCAKVVGSVKSKSGLAKTGGSLERSCESSKE